MNEVLAFHMTQQNLLNTLPLTTSLFCQDFTPATALSLPQYASDSPHEHCRL